MSPRPQAVKAGVAAKLVITTGKAKGQHPSVATVMRLVYHEEPVD
ncbi:hypothetical protein [Streptomyces sp. NPDC003710]